VHYTRSHTVWVKKNPRSGLRCFDIFSQTTENFISIFYTPITRSYLR